MKLHDFLIVNMKGEEIPNAVYDVLNDIVKMNIGASDIIPTSSDIHLQCIY